MTMLTFTGRDFNVLTFSRFDFEIADVAHANSLNCRYNGHCRFNYSVAQHSILLSDALSMLSYNAETVLYALLHDSAEAYLSDVPTPVKSIIPEYEKWENKVLDVVLEETGREIFPSNPKEWLNHVDYEIVKKADRSMVFYEMRALFDYFPTGFHFENVMMLPPFEVIESGAEVVEDQFLKIYRDRIKRLKEYNTYKVTEL